MSQDGASRPPAEPGAGWLDKADLWAGTATIIFALAVLTISADYGLGRAGRIGAGYVPLVVGLLLLGIGALLVARSGRSHDLVDTHIAWRQVVLVTAGIVAFALLLDRVGLVVAIIATVMVAGPAALGNTVLTMAVSGMLLSGFSWLLFVHLLKISIPVWWF